MEGWILGGVRLVIAIGVLTVSLSASPAMAQSGFLTKPSAVTAIERYEAASYDGARSSWHIERCRRTARDRIVCRVVERWQAIPDDPSVTVVKDETTFSFYVRVRREGQCVRAGATLTRDQSVLSC